MAFTYRIDPEHAFAHVRFSGIVTGADPAQATPAVFDDPAWTPGATLIWDCRQVAYLDIGLLDVGRIVLLGARFWQKRGPGRDAILVRRDSMEEIARLFAWRTQGRPGQKTRVFRDAVEAEVWLELPEGTLCEEPADPVAEPAALVAELVA
ncbi:MAG TPA: hypothetical protein VK610_09340 [Rhodothermales bacterium]|nr:hypothetical protein [Rhodothermales bacterium]